MITLVLVVCLSASPNVCHEERPPIDAVSPMACLVQAEQIAAEWVREHPKYQLTGWRCQFGQRQRGA